MHCIQLMIHCIINCIMLNKDVFGIICSGLCLIHCLATPALLALGVTGLGLSYLEQEWIHWVFFTPMVLLLLISLPSGFEKHLNKLPLILGLSGGALLLFSLTVLEVYTEWFIVVASVLIMAGHFFNRKFLKTISTE